LQLSNEAHGSTCHGCSILYSVPIIETLLLLAEHFQVEDISDLPATVWPTVLDWFKDYLLSGYLPKP
jgi:hypothetical protein